MIDMALQECIHFTREVLAQKQEYLLTEWKRSEERTEDIKNKRKECCGSHATGNCPRSGEFNLDYWLEQNLVRQLENELMLTFNQMASLAKGPSLCFVTGDLTVRFWNGKLGENSQ